MALTVTNLNKNYGENKVVDKLSFSIDKPGVFGLLGTNGAGKTTTIRMILGMINKDGGTVTWNGENYTPNTVSTGYLAEERGIYAKFSIIDQLVYFGELKGMSKADAIKSIDYWLERLEATEYKNKKADQLSKGNQQKIQFIAALISNPSLLILDEPLSGLDPVNTDLFKEVIKEQIGKGKYIIMSSHQMNTIEEFCENLLILNKGKTILQGNLKEIKKGYGRNRLLVRCDEDIKHLIKECNMEIESENAEEINLMVKSQEEVNRLLKRITDENISLVKFELREPSLHEIFIEKVGGQ
ncbi:ATP-binding cassette domain-containing protein [Clostridium gasigenes]|uniref:ABC transporter ATP-binding protein n=1 Tax=Clostridium gasigenes TaxID=94869 RepID=UPI0014384D8E|nr:ATP-binding cassette domain-containing protein [Clostridium gasigenes]NKF08870.1 ATP-binding cassette domain-containing protein [Clostridium gasigenes]QSW18575.1 ATP-binding cassette domain-containing protein [Clostridium gasigenes]